MDSDPNRGLLFVLSVVITGAFCLFGFIGNILALIVLVRDKHKNSNIYLLSALAVSDWLMLLFIFHGVVVIRICKFLHHVTCLTCMQQVLRALWAMGCTVQLATAWCVVAVTWDRVMAISKPFKTMKKAEHVTRAKKLIVMVFIFSVAFNLPRWFHFRIIQDNNTATQRLPDGAPSAGNNSKLYLSNDTGDNGPSPPCISQDLYYNVFLESSNVSVPVNFSGSKPEVLLDSTNCTHPSSPQTQLWQNKFYHYLYYIVLSWLVYYIIPICSLIVLNFFLIRQIRACIRNQREIAPTSRRGKRDSVSITINIVAVVTIFIICQIPDFVHSLITDPDFGMSRVGKTYLGAVAYLFLSFNSSINFGVYCLFYGRFRKRLLTMFCPGSSQRETNRIFNKVSLTSQSYL